MLTREAINRRVFMDTKSNDKRKVNKGNSPSIWSNSVHQLKTELRRFYLDHPPDLSMITDLNRRHFRMVLPNGRFLKIKDVIRNTSDLQKWLQRLAPLHVYYSTSTWLNPVVLSPRPKKPGPGFLDSGIILSHDIAYDIDRTPLLRRNIEDARNETLKLLTYMTKKGYDLKYIAFSGSKGFHIVFKDKPREIIPDPYTREMNLIKEKTALTNEILNAGIDIDTTVTKDTRRIFRVPGTINTRTGYACTVIPRADLECSFNNFFKQIPRLPSSTKIPVIQLPKSEIPMKITKIIDGLRMTALRKSATREGGRGGSEGIGLRWRPGNKRTGDHYPTEPGYYFTTFLQSSVLGTKERHAVLLSFRQTPAPAVEKRVGEIISRFRLSDFYLFRLQDRIIALCLSTVQGNRFQRILDHAKVENSGQLMKYQVISVRVGPLVDPEMREIVGPIDYLKTISAPDETNDSRYVSQGHLNFIRKHGITTYDYPKVHGSDQFKVVDAILKM